METSATSDSRPEIAKTRAGQAVSVNVAAKMPASLDDTLISVWKQALFECRPSVTLDGRSSPVRETSQSKLREVNFQFDGHMVRGLEQNPNTSSRWGQLAREGKKVMQFLSGGRYVANVVDGKVHLYDRERK